MTDVVVVLVSGPTVEWAEESAARLVDERLAACVNVLPGIRSVYSWEGEIRKDEEVLLVIKTTAGCLERLQVRIEELHSYDVPEVVVVPVADGSERYLDWVRGSVED